MFVILIFGDKLAYTGVKKPCLWKLEEKLNVWEEATEERIVFIKELDPLELKRLKNKKNYYKKLIKF